MIRNRASLSLLNAVVRLFTIELALIVGFKVCVLLNSVQIVSLITAHRIEYLVAACTLHDDSRQHARGLDSVVRGHHIYKRMWTSTVREKVPVGVEEGNPNDPKAGCCLTMLAGRPVVLVVVNLFTRAWWRVDESKSTPEHAAVGGERTKDYVS